MSAQFAGARSLDERRRRRLAGETPQVPSVKSRVKAKAPEAESQTAEVPEQQSASVTHHSPLLVVIPKTLWKLRLIGIAVLVLSTTLLITGLYSTESWRPGLQTLFNLQQGTVWPVLTGMSLFVCAQLSLVILWFRRLSVRDFDGRYRTWLWAAANFSLYSVVAFLNLQTLFGQVLCDLTGLPSTQWLSLIWLTPTVGLLLDVLRNLEKEITRVPEAWWFLNLSSMFGITAAVCLWAESSTFMFAPGWGVIRICLVMACSMLFYSLMVFARHVMYYSVDPAPRRKSITAEVMKNIGQVTWLAIAPLKARLALRAEDRKQRHERQQRIKRLCRIVRDAYQERSLTDKQRLQKQQQADRVAQKAQQLADREAMKAEKLAAKDAARAQKKAAAEAAKAEKLKQKQMAAEEKELLRLEKQEKAKQLADEKAALKKAAQEEKAALKKQAEEQKAAQKMADFEKRAREKMNTQAQPEPETEQQPATRKPRIRLGGSAAKNQQAEDNYGEAQAEKAQKQQEMMQTAGQIVRHDQPDGIDPEMLKGLSKKERRRLRKQHREMQRQNNSDDEY